MRRFFFKKKFFFVQRNDDYFNENHCSSGTSLARFEIKDEYDKVYDIVSESLLKLFKDLICQMHVCKC